MVEKDELAQVLEGAMNEEASDIHIKTGIPVTIRKKGQLEYLTEEPLGSSEVESILETLLTLEKRAAFRLDNQVDTSCSFNGNRYRANTFRDENGVSIAIRVIPNQIIPIEEIGFPYDAIWQDICKLDKGLVLVSGPTNSGKSTTLASIIQRINYMRGEHIITIEDPIEYVHHPKKSIVSQREVGRSVPSFEKALEAALRQDPNILLIGEVRDKETAKIALQAASSGHLVFTTLHSGDSGQAVWEYASRFPSEEQESARRQLADSLKYVLCQKLIPYESGKERTLIMEVANVYRSNAVKNMIRKGEYNNIVDQISRESANCSITMAQHAKSLGFDVEE